MPPASERPRRFSMLRSFVLADLITLGNAASGTLSLFFCLNYLDTHERTYVWFALGLLPLALICDILDGTVARWRRKHSPLGADLDSLADVISFGVAPAVLGYTLGLRGAWDMVALVFFVCCGISRLARYNVTAASLSDDSGKVKYYQGTPIPSSLLLVLVLGILFSMGHVHEQLWLGEIRLGPGVLHPLSLLFVLSGNAMISATLRIPKP
ncbi:CDP-alcohol phosphatidyltransferase family protein [Chondromyces crocatus]|uniref:CDP-diacylglycerol--serine O-phosphatidyltransferase n=1 Tax=Chondromyces crocatus TaxID=52 RepID=A0A0K1EIM6_CHOCO|nr:CDP-alcohol phosphatidyltransferase family protein [Chondromyces crocatus]AKT40710.1 CDP-diacylglycerol--serine O-phosphatidyltransferase [Chondromyces crocatus]